MSLPTYSWAEATETRNNKIAAAQIFNIVVPSVETFWTFH